MAASITFSRGTSMKPSAGKMPASAASERSPQFRFIADADDAPARANGA
jgi:hypothetical protein